MPGTPGASFSSDMFDWSSCRSAANKASVWANRVISFMVAHLLHVAACRLLSDCPARDLMATSPPPAPVGASGRAPSSGFAASALQKTILTTNHAFVFEAIFQGLTGAEQSHCEIIDRHTEIGCDRFPRLARKVYSPNDLGVFRLQQRQMSIQTFADRILKIGVLIRGNAVAQFGGQRDFPRLVLRGLTMEIGDRRGQNLAEPPADRIRISNVGRTLKSPQYERLQYLFRVRRRAEALLQIIP